MIDDHIRGKISEALAATSRNRRDAQRLLVTWAMRDPALLLRMTKPHLKAITTALIEHFLRTEKDAADADQGPDFITRTAIDDIVASAKSGRRGPDRRGNRNLPPPKSTERQATTMRRLAAAYTKKKK